MDTLYYSNYCKHSQRVLQYLVKTDLTNKISFLCIDKRKKDVNNNQIYIELENGQKVIMPPHVQSVPALLLVNQNYKDLLFEYKILLLNLRDTKLSGDWAKAHSEEAVDLISNLK